MTHSSVEGETRTRFSRESLIGYADLTVFHEILSEHSLIDIELKRVGEFLYSKYFSRGGPFNATGYANFSIVQLDRPIKR